MPELVWKRLEGAAAVARPLLRAEGGGAGNCPVNFRPAVLAVACNTSLLYICLSTPTPPRSMGVAAVIKNSVLGFSTDSWEQLSHPPWVRPKRASGQGQDGRVRQLPSTRLPCPLCQWQLTGRQLSRLAGSEGPPFFSPLGVPEKWGEEGHVLPATLQCWTPGATAGRALPASSWLLSISNIAPKARHARVLPGTKQEWCGRQAPCSWDLLLNLHRCCA